MVLTDDLFTLPPERLATARVLMTLIDGEVVYAAEASASGEPAGDR